VVASEGYPDAPVTGREVEGADPASPGDDGDVLCFHGATERDPDGRIVTNGGRVATTVGRGDSLAAAREATYRGVANVGLEGAQFRSDIALRELEVGERPELSRRSR
jgi:phosphoribosylamine--glycine ligase